MVIVLLHFIFYIMSAAAAAKSLQSCPTLCDPIDGNHELPDVPAGFRKGRGTRDQIANIHWSSKKQESSRKTSTSALLTTPKPLTVWITTNWKILQPTPGVYLNSCPWSR